MSRRDRKGVLQDEGSHIVKRQENDPIIARDGTEGEAFESSEDSLGSEKIGEAMMEATMGHEPLEAAE
ncbi:hypothetical protein Syun_027990 [Stephania yunnanensis]|uniref:Uncharacterized protein n=1 Tax=Stephania yunnanensis TaxID=152371 RepID=A0AAP0EGY4_9MAGN